MSNCLTCPGCGVVTSDSTWPSEGWGHLVTQHQVDATSGTEDPASVVQSGEKMYVCPCGDAIWRPGVGWLVKVASLT